MFTSGQEEAMAAQLNADGFAIVQNVLEPETVEALLSALAGVTAANARIRQGATFAARDLLRAVPLVREVAISPAIQRLAATLLGAEAFAMRGIFFDKPPEANWKVPYHQDLTIAVQAQREVPGFGPWTTKAGVPHTHAPVDVLERLLTIRLHLDDCHAANGPLRVLPGSHRHGKLDSTRIQQLRDEISETVCIVPRGGALLMRPLLLHASSPALSPGHRRVLHIEYASSPLPEGLEWQECVPLPKPFP